MAAKDLLQQEFADLFREIVDRKLGMDPTVGMKNLAERVGVYYQTFTCWPRGTRPIHADKLALLCKELDDLTLLDWLERQVGRVAYVPVPADDKGKAMGALEIAGFLIKVGDALSALGEGIEIARAESERTKEIIASLDGVIRECLRLKSWVNMQLRAKR